jgi:hypothetical protein
MHMYRTLGELAEWWTSANLGSPGLRVHGPAMVIGRQAVVAPHLFAHGAPWDLDSPEEIDLLEPTKMTALLDLIELILEREKDLPEQKKGKIVVHSDLVKILPLLLYVSYAASIRTHRRSTQPSGGCSSKP